MFTVLSESWAFEQRSLLCFAALFGIIGDNDINESFRSTVVSGNQV